MKINAGTCSLALTVSAALVFVACSSDEGGSGKGDPGDDAGTPDGGGDGAAAAGGAPGAGGSPGSGGAPAAGGSAPDGGDNACPADAGNGRCVVGCTHPTLPECGAWVKVEPPGAVCSNGSQYKFFVNYSATSDNVVVSFEPGGACWDYESCSGAGGIRGAANPNGIDDGHMATFGFLNHLGPTDQNPLKDWNKVFVSYCTGDVHTGNNQMVYDNPVDGGAPLTYRHRGHDNVQSVITFLAGAFQNVPKMLVTGCSAGGAGALLNYHFIRKGMGSQVEKGYLLDDSGPIFDSTGPSAQVHAKIRSSWNVDPILDSLEGELPIPVADIKANFGLINTALATAYPDDRLAFTAYRMDFNYSLYSYQRFFPGSTEQEIHDYWWTDMQGLMTRYDAQPNMAYFIPFFRPDNCSHCVSIPPLDHLAEYLATNTWWGTDIAADNMDLRDFTVDLLDDAKPLTSYVEDLQPTEVFTPEQSASCMAGGGTIPGQ